MIKLKNFLKLRLWPLISRICLCIVSFLIPVVLFSFSAFALALAALYENESEMNVSEADVVGVLAAASFLGFTSLEKL